MTLFACGGGGIEGFVGESISITAENPEEGEDVDFSWSLAGQPDGSLLNSSDLHTSQDDQRMSFEPDYPGDFSVEVVVSQYSDEISSQIFTFSIVDPGETKKVKDEKIEEEQDEEWLNEDIEEDVDIAYQGEEARDSDIEVENEVEEIESENNAPVAEISPSPVAEASVEVPKKRVSIQDKTGRFTIQITSKKILKDAHKFAQKMISEGYDAYIQKAIFDPDEIWYRVRVGSYDNYNSAKAAADALAGELGMATWVDFVRIEQ